QNTKINTKHNNNSSKKPDGFNNEELNDQAFDIAVIMGVKSLSNRDVTYKGIFEYQQHIFYLCTLEINEVIVGKALLAYTS
ncbi:5987_t:CDS:2, partial [Entrophospora sp. SA101]